MNKTHSTACKNQNISFSNSYKNKNSYLPEGFLKLPLIIDVADLIVMIKVKA